MTAVAQLTEKGILKFKEWIEDARDSEVNHGKTMPLPLNLLKIGHYSATIGINWRINQAEPFTTRYDLAKYLHETSQKAGITQSEISNDHMWAWLALFYSDKLRNPGAPKKGGDPLTVRQEHWIPAELLELTETEVNRQSHRHSVRIAYQLFDRYGVGSKLFFSKQLHYLGEGIEQTQSRRTIRESDSLIALLRHKYEAKDGYFRAGTWAQVPKPKKKAAIKKKTGFGCARRMIKDFIPSIALTYDYDEMSPIEICKLSTSGEF